jgi:hypothetical protein
MTIAALPTIDYILISIIIISFVIIGLALRGSHELWAILGTIASILAIIVNIVIASPQLVLPVPPSRQAKAAPSPGVTSLPPSSPLRKRGPSIDELCGDLGLSQHAWLPGQTAATNLSGRVIWAPGAAYTWSCNKNGPKLRRDVITHGCYLLYPGTKAYTWDPNNAYSWVCI